MRERENGSRLGRVENACLFENTYLFEQAIVDLRTVVLSPGIESDEWYDLQRAEAAHVEFRLVWGWERGRETRVHLGLTRACCVVLGDFSNTLPKTRMSRDSSRDALSRRARSLSFEILRQLGPETLF